MVFTGLIKLPSTRLSPRNGCRYTEISAIAPLASAAEARDLHWLALLVAIGALGNTLTTVIGCVLAQPRLCFAMAQARRGTWQRGLERRPRHIYSLYNTC